MKTKDSIHFIMTGGTIDSCYDGTKDTVIPGERSIIPRYIEMLRLYVGSEFTEVCMKDSRALSRDDREKVLEVVESSPCKNVIITHGTYTMPDTARFLKSNLKRNDQTIIFTGSLVPLEGFSPSDGGFSLGYAVAQVDILPAGIYVCMNGRSFDPDEVVKLLSEGRFDSVFNR